MKTVNLDADRIMNKEDMGDYMHEIFLLPAHSGRNLDSIHDLLSETRQDTMFLLSHACVKKICQNAYAFKVLRVLGRAADENPHIHIRFDVHPEADSDQES
jgi:RNAse (barnase) inhibitor barstar